MAGMMRTPNCFDRSFALRKVEDATVDRRKHIETIGSNQSRCMRTSGRGGSRTDACPWVDRLNQPGRAYGHVHQATVRIEERRIGGAIEGPPVIYRSSDRIDFHERAVVTGDVEQVRLMVDIDAVSAGRWNCPV